MDTRLTDTADLPDGQGPDGGIAPAVDTREERRRERLARLEEMDDMIRFAADRLKQYIAGELFDREAEPFAGITDPCVTLTRLARAQRQIVALQEKLEDDAEARARRLADEAAKREKAACAAEAEQEATDKAERIEGNKRLIRRAMKEASFERGPGRGLASPEREKLLGDLMSDYERHDDLDRDVVEIMEDLEREIGLMAGRAEPDSPEDEAAANLRQLVITIERRLLRLLAKTEPEDPEPADPAEAGPTDEQRPWEPP